MTLALFFLFGGLTLLAGAGVVLTRNIVYAALFLLASLSGIAGLFVLLFAEFLALVQVLIYGGAIVIVILFALMLTRQQDYQGPTEHHRWPFAAAVSFLLFVAMAFAFVSDAGRYNTEERGSVGIEGLGRALFEQYAIPFEVASVLLLIALVGAILVARTIRDDDEPKPLAEDDAPDEPRTRRRRGGGRAAAGRRNA